MIGNNKVPYLGPYKPTLILHGGAGNITRQQLPPDLYAQYESSLLEYLGSTQQRLLSGVSALDSAVHAVSLMEDNPLFNCGKGSVFTEKGTIEMEASVMVASLDPERSGQDEQTIVAQQKRGAGVMLVKHTRHPIQLAREVLLIEPNGSASSKHCQLSGEDLEEWGWKERGLERQEDGWFWTKKRWQEHLRGLQKDCGLGSSERDIELPIENADMTEANDADSFLPSQGTVGAVCMDSWGDVAVATSTGGLTNKRVGRIGDTPTLGAGFWAESWEEKVSHPFPPTAARLEPGRNQKPTPAVSDRLSRALAAGFDDLLLACLPQRFGAQDEDEPLFSPSTDVCEIGSSLDRCVAEYRRTGEIPSWSLPPKRSTMRTRAIAISGTGNGDTFLRTAACRTTAAICRFSAHGHAAQPISLAKAMHLTTGKDGELQRSAGDRWKVTGEGQAGMIGIEVIHLNCAADESASPYHCRKSDRLTGSVVFDFNCGGLWRAWIDGNTGRKKVMVFKEEYK